MPRQEKARRSWKFDKPLQVLEQKWFEPRWVPEQDWTHKLDEYYQKHPHSIRQYNRNKEEWYRPKVLRALKAVKRQPLHIFDICQLVVGTRDVHVFTLVAIWRAVRSIVRTGQAQCVEQKEKYYNGHLKTLMLGNRETITYKQKEIGWRLRFVYTPQPRGRRIGFMTERTRKNLWGPLRHASLRLKRRDRVRSRTFSDR